MKEFFNNIKTWLAQNDRKIVINHLLEGADKNIHELIYDKTGLLIPKQLYELYQISQGTAVKKGDKLNDLHFFPGFYFIPIERSIKMYNNYKDDERWNENWFPIFANGGGDFYCVDCSNKDKSPVIEFMLDYDAEIIHKSLIDFFQSLDACFQTGAYYVDERNYLEIDYNKEAKIRDKVNQRNLI